jgi:1,4-alpha-glucan branching enzyme
MGIHAMIDVRFVYLTGQGRPAFCNARLAGSWNGWADIPMAEIVAEDGCPAFAATVRFDDGQARERVLWGVRLDGPAGANAWGIMTDVQQRQRELQLPGPGASAEARYYVTWSRRLGAQKYYAGGSAVPDLRFAV